jgi:hypothetical protein
MTTTTARLYAVPDPTPREAPPWILRLKKIARRAYDLALSVPRGAPGWAVSTLTRWGRTLAAAMPGLTSALARAGRAATTVGILPITAAALATPQVTRPLAGLARRVIATASGPLSRLGRWVASGLRALDPVGPALLDLAGRLRTWIATAIRGVAGTMHRVLGENGHEHATTASRALSYAWLARRLVLALTGAARAAVAVPLGVAGLTFALLRLGPGTNGPRPAQTAAKARPVNRATPPAEQPCAVTPEVTVLEPDDATAVPGNRAARRAAQQAAARSRRR